MYHAAVARQANQAREDRRRNREERNPDGGVAAPQLLEAALEEDERDEEVQFGDAEGEPQHPQAEPVQQPEQQQEEAMAALEGLEALVQALRQAQTAGIKIPEFGSDTKVKPEDHVMKMEDHFARCNIDNDENRLMTFRTSLLGQPRQWYENIANRPNHWTVVDGADGIRELFLNRWNRHGQNRDAWEQKWRELKWDPNTQDVETFLTELTALATRLGYGDAAQITAIRACLPSNLSLMATQYNDINDLKRWLVMVGGNPKYIKQPKAQENPTQGTTFGGAFSAMQEHEEEESLYYQRDNRKGRDGDRNWKPYITKRGRGRPAAGSEQRDRTPRDAEKGRSQRQDQGRREDRRERGERDRDQRGYGRRSYDNKGSYSRGRGSYRRDGKRDERKQAPRDSAENRRCYYCGNPGHLERDCRIKKREQGEQENTRRGGRDGRPSRDGERRRSRDAVRAMEERVMNDPEYMDALAGRISEHMTRLEVGENPPN